MLKATVHIYERYNLDDRETTAANAKKTFEQLHCEYLEALFTSACRQRLDIWDFTQKFMESDFSLCLDKAEMMLSIAKDELFGKFMIFCTQNKITLEKVTNEKANMQQFRTLSPEGKWLAALYSRWHATTGEAGCEIAERAHASLLKKICKKAQTHKIDDVVALLLENSAIAARIESYDYRELQKLTKQQRD